MSRSSCERDRAVAGFTLIEVVVALALVAVALTAIGALIATTVRGTRALDQHLSLAETARAVEAALPGRDELTEGSSSGEMAGYRWRIDVGPFVASFVDPRLATPWVPQTVVITVRAPDGPALQISTVRLRRRTDQ
ncbi:MAG TPA: prepilin-type N-terminal cleavage/methylation domain-containing protein [Xanthobacteraceae bacterium]|nr:prepilin-type N-terminal cleavage/methylation domain-containing protein [Xanthobacteraceae bacterium]